MRVCLLQGTCQGSIEASTDQMMDQVSSQIPQNEVEFCRSSSRYVDRFHKLKRQTCIKTRLRLSLRQYLFKLERFLSRLKRAQRNSGKSRVALTPTQLLSWTLIDPC